MALQLGPDVSHHGGSAYPGLQDAYGDYESSTKGGNAYKTVENGHGKDASSLTDKVSHWPPFSSF